MKQIKKLFAVCYRFYSAIMGMFIFRSIKSGIENVYFFLKFGHLGDVVRSLSAISLYKQYLLSQDIKIKKIIVIIASNQKGLVKINPEINETIVLSKKKIKYLRRFAESKWNHYHLFTDSYGPFHTSEVYKIPYEYVKNNLEYFRINDIVNGQFANDSLAYVKEKEINPEKTLILVPYAGSSSSLPFECLDPLIKHYQNLGFRVFTNAGLSESPLLGTEPLTEPANVVFGIINMGATVIGVQSGFMDSCEWLNLTHKRIKIFWINTEHDKEYLHNYNYSLERHVERRGSGVTVVVSDEEQKKILCDEIKNLGRYYLKGTIQKKLISTDWRNKFACLYTFLDFNQYVEEICKFNHLVLIMSSTGSASLNKGFAAKYLLHINQIKDNYNFLAVYDTDNGLVEALSSEDLVHGLTYLGTIEDNQNIDPELDYPTENWLYVYSNAKDKLGYSKASIVINGEEYSSNQEGLNVVVYSKEYCAVIDCFSVNFHNSITNNIIRANIKN